MKTRRLRSTGELDHAEVAALVVVALGTMKRLVNVADEMHEELQCLDAVGNTRIGVGQFFAESADGFDNTSAMRFAIASGDVFRGFEWNVGEVPRCAVCPIFTNVVRPTRHAA